METIDKKIENCVDIGMGNTTSQQGDRVEQFVKWLQYDEDKYGDDWKEFTGVEPWEPFEHYDEKNYFEIVDAAIYSLLPLANVTPEQYQDWKNRKQYVGD